MNHPFRLSWRHKLEILFDGFLDRQLFATNAEIREATRRKIREIQIRETRRHETERILDRLEDYGIVLPPALVEEIRRDATK